MVHDRGGIAAYQRVKMCEGVSQREKTCLLQQCIRSAYGRNEMLRMQLACVRQKSGPEYCLIVVQKQLQT